MRGRNIACKLKLDETSLVREAPTLFDAGQLWQEKDRIAWILADFRRIRERHPLFLTQVNCGRRRIELRGSSLTSGELERGTHSF